MSEEQYIKLVEEKADELQNNPLELHAFVTENSPELTAEQHDDLVRDLEGNYIEIEHYVNTSLSSLLD